MNRLEFLKVFCSVAETLHFREAAGRLAVSPQVVTRTINTLEKELGEVLFQRNTRQVKLTEFGRQFLPKAEQLLKDADRLFNNAKKPPEQKDISGLVRIAMFDSPLIQAVLEELLKRLTPYPDLQIECHLALEKVDVVNHQIDVGIRFGTPEDSRLIIRQAGRTEDCIVANPALLEKTGRPESWESLQDNYPLGGILNPATGRAWAWYLSNSLQFVPRKPKFLSDTIANDLIAARAGLTISCLPRISCKPYLESGELVEILPELERKQWIAYVYRPQQTVVPSRVRLVFDLLAEILPKRL